MVLWEVRGFLNKRGGIVSSLICEFMFFSHPQSMRDREEVEMKGMRGGMGWR